MAVVNVRCSKDNMWGFPETFKKYSYEGVGYVEIVGVVTPEGKLSEPFVFRGGEFIPASQIDSEMGIEKYIKAKKPFYSRLNDGFIVTIRAGADFTKKEFLPERTSYTVYRIEMVNGDNSNAQIRLVSILEVPGQVCEMLMNLAMEVAGCWGDRAAYLRSRFVESGEEETEEGNADPSEVAGVEEPDFEEDLVVTED